MRLPGYLAVLRRGWILILVMVLLGTGAGVLLTVLTKPTYRSNVQLFVTATSTASDTGAGLAGGNAFTTDRVQSYVNIANSPAVTTPVIAALKLNLTDAELAKKISADAPQNTGLLNLHVTDRSPTVAQTIAAAVSKQFQSYITQKIETPTGSTVSAVKLSEPRPATLPSQPVSPRKVVNILGGFLLGLVLGVGIVLIRDALDDTVKGPSDFTELGVPVLGLVPFDRKAARAPLAFRADPHSSRSEAYRAIRTNLQFVDIDNPPRLIAVTSALPGEGKTTTSLNLASALAEAGYRVCLIDADLRRPSVAKTLGLVGDVGLTSVLIGNAALEDVLQNAGRNLAVLTSGPIPPNPSELLSSEHARAVIADIESKVDFCIVDTPPLLPVTDAAQLATVVDATLLVNRSGRTTVAQTTRAIANLTQVGEKPVGVIINMITRSRGRGEDEYGYYYAYTPEKEPRGRKGRKGLKAATAETPAAIDPATDAATPADGEVLPLDDLVTEHVGDHAAETGTPADDKAHTTT